MSNQYILFGAGTIGRLIARQLIAKAETPLAFADNDELKWGTFVEGIRVENPATAQSLYPDAKWVATVHRIPARPEILAQLKAMGVEQVSLYEFLPARCDLPPFYANRTVQSLITDKESRDEWTDQIRFRRNPSTYAQRPPRDISNVYFEDFFTHRDDEHFVDCGAADGDTIKAFKEHWTRYDYLTAFEPDPNNYEELCEHSCSGLLINAAVSDFNGETGFTATGDQTAHFGGDYKVWASKLDSVDMPPPTFIKMDIEGSELEGLWGAREIIKKHSPVLAICAYHLGSHLWEVPLLIHALNPTYKLYLRRYLEATWELIWYAVPPERVK